MSGKYCYDNKSRQTWLDAKARAKDKQLDHLFVPSDRQNHLTNLSALTNCLSDQNETNRS